MNDVISYVQYVISSNSMVNKRKRRSGDVFDNSRRSYKYLAAVMVYNALTEESNLQTTLLRVLSDLNFRLKLMGEVDLLLATIVKHFRINGHLQIDVDIYKDHLMSLVNGNNVVKKVGV